MRMGKHGASSVAIGGALAVTFSLADVIGLGRYSGFGSDQAIGTIGGLVIVLVGLLLVLLSKTGAKPL